MKIFVHCYSSTVIKILLAAKASGKKFTVYNSEVRPKLLGRRTAKILAENGIKVVHMVDLAAPIALKECNLLLIGVEGFTKTGKILNKIGTNNLLHLAHQYGIKSYACTLSNKAQKIRKQSPTHVWKNPPKNVEIFNPGFEEVDPKSLTGLITEKGLL